MKFLSLIITHIGALPNTPTHSPPCPAPCCPNSILLGPEEPMTKWPTAQSGGVSRPGPERGLLTEGPRGPGVGVVTLPFPSPPPHTCCSQIQSPFRTQMPASPYSPPPSCRPPGSPEAEREASSRHPQPPHPGSQVAKASGTCSGLSRGLSRPAPSFRVKNKEVVPEPQP